MKILVVLASLTSLILAQAPSEVCATYKDMLDGCYVHFRNYYNSNETIYEIFKDGKKLCRSYYENGRLGSNNSNACENKGLR